MKIGDIIEYSERHQVLGQPIERLPRLSDNYEGIFRITSIEDERLYVEPIYMNQKLANHYFALTPERRFFLHKNNILKHLTEDMLQERILAII